MILDLIIACFAITYIVGHSGIVFDLSGFIWRLTHKGKEWNYQVIGKPFGCAVCLTFWFTLGYMLLNSYGFILAIGVASFMPIVSVLIDRLLRLLFVIINKI
jgi:hypothetical protein